MFASLRYLASLRETPTLIPETWMSGSRKDAKYAKTQSDTLSVL
jgi:hypothetical protein